MKLYYDNLIAYMPAATFEEGKEPVPDRKLSAARDAMIMLADFQNTHNIFSLYKSVASIAVYADIDIVDLILSLGDIEIEENNIDDALDIAAKNLFKTVSSNEPKGQFDYKYYAAILLSVAHALLESQRKYMEEMAAAQKQQAEEESADTEKTAQ